MIAVFHLKTLIWGVRGVTDVRKEKYIQKGNTLNGVDTVKSKR
ncbi:hypothetical protein JCM19274_2949 [Algibacter lectus]|uniref:Uncharacterized protein n=1 Tax=Algibacter lectus TaxID=221126 RepID=A0A090X753_9FLAO|nr:hypothetical protein JCM19274_2949 [Algibacter lectus]